MKVIKRNQPRKFLVGKNSSIEMLDTGTVILEENEQVTFKTLDGKEYDVFAEIVWERSSFCERWDVEDARYKGLHKLSGSSCLVCGNINEGISIPTDEDVMLSIIERETESLC